MSLFQGWVSLLTVLLVVRPWIQPGGSVSSQLWEPERRAKSLGFLGKGEDGQIREVEDNGIEEDVEKKETEKKKDSDSDRLKKNDESKRQQKNKQQPAATSTSTAVLPRPTTSNSTIKLIKMNPLLMRTEM